MHLLFGARGVQSADEGPTHWDLTKQGLFFVWIADEELSLPWEP
jgi:hypothetical protein